MSKIFLVLFICVATQLRAQSTFTATLSPPSGSATLCSGVAYTFSANVNPPGSYYYSWSCSPTGGVMGFNPNPSPNNTAIGSFNNPGTYTITVQVADGQGHFDMANLVVAVSICNGIESAFPTPKINTRPNPVDRTLYIEGVEILQDITLRFFNFRGEQIQNVKLNSSNVDVTNLPDGMYIIQILIGERVNVKTKIFIAHG